MKLIVSRRQTYHGFPLNKFEYFIRVKVDFTSEETQLLEKYKGWSEQVRLLSDNQLVKGMLSVSIKTLSKDGAEWSDESVYTTLSDIPDVIGTRLKGLFGNYHVREQWGEANANEVIKVATQKEKNV